MRRALTDREEAMSGRRFDLVLIVDWSARSARSPARPSADAIWVGAAGAAGAEAPRYFRGRAEATDWLAGRMAMELAAGRRVLAGFDFPFGWPRGAAARVTGRPAALAVWDWLAAAVTDGVDNRNDRYAVAARLNALWPGEGPFWGRPRSVWAPGVSERKGDWRSPGRDALGWPPERRHVEARESGAKTCWQLAYAGSVGSQVLLGLPSLARLRADPRLAGRVAVWPFETGWSAGDAPAVLAEIYPSMLARAVAARRGADPARRDGREILDRAQVRVLADAFAALDAAGGLAPLFGPPPGLQGAGLDEAEREEAWILGRDAKGALEAALGAA